MLTSPYGNSYIGQTTRCIEERFGEHQKPSKCVAIYNAIQKYGWENMRKEWYEVPDEDLNFYEEILIALLGTLSPGGYNLKEGGANGRDSDATKQKKSKSRQGEKNPNYGKIATTAARQLMREANLGEKNPRFGKNHTEDSKKLIREAKLGENNYRSQKVYQYDKNGFFIQSFASSGEAARHMNKKCGAANIRKCAHDNSVTMYKFAYGFKWSYIEPV